MIEQLMGWLEEAQSALEAGLYDNAISAFLRVQELIPADASIAMALANSYRLNGNAGAARRTLLAAHAVCDWSDPTVAFSLGAALLDSGAPHEAVACFSSTVQLLPNDAAAHGALAGARRAKGNATAAWTPMQRALALAPKNPALLLTAAQIRHDLKDFAGARQWLDRAEALRPDHGPTQLQRAYTALIQGASDEGWALFDARPLPVPVSNARAWHGEPLAGGSVLVTAEQGVGDQFQFARFIGALHARGAGRVIMECHADAVSLFTASGFDAIARNAKTPDTDWHVPLLSLPRWLHTGADVFGDQVPYLRAPHIANAEPLPPPSKPGQRRFGLVWAGNPDFPGRVTRDLDRDQLPAIVSTPGIDWFSLQHGDAANPPIAGLARIPLPTGWEATASILKQLDGLVTTDTGIAHLAGAMGVPTWVLLGYVPDWRWGAEGETTPWYPSARLIRQLKPLDWAGAVTVLHKRLSEFQRGSTAEEAR